MMNSAKTRPSDGSEEEKEEEEKEDKMELEEEIELEEAHEQKALSEQKELDKFVAEAEAEHDRMEKEKKDELEKLKRDRERPGGDADTAGSESEQMIGGQKVRVQKEYVVKKGMGIFNRRGKRDDFGSSKFKQQVERKLKMGAHGVDIKQQREFMQLLSRYHGLKGKNTATLEKEEVMKFEAGLRRGSSDARFKTMSQQMKEEGLIKNTADVKKFFSKRDVKRMSNVLLGRRDENAYNHIDKTDISSHRGASEDPKSMRRF